MKRLLTAAAMAATLTMPLAATADEVASMTRNAARKQATTPAAMAYGASMNKMMAAMDVKPTGDPDKDFVSMMMPHHRGAVDMARVELQYGRDPVLRAMADDIVKAQEKEIAAMTAWRARNGR